MKKRADSDLIIRPEPLTSYRAEKISAVEGMILSPRMRAILAQSALEGLNGEQRRALIRSVFDGKTPD